MVTDSPKRKHASSACQPCRDSKIRCDAVHPVCGNCFKKERDCQYSTKDDKRRVSLRTAVEILADRIVTLIEVLNRHHVAVPPMKPQQETTLHDICVTLKLTLPDFNTSAIVESGIEPSSGAIPNVATSTVDVPAANAEPALPVVISDPAVWQDSGTIDLNDFAATATYTQQPDGAQIRAPRQSFNDGQDYPSVSDGPPTDGTPVEWPWHMFKSDFFTLPDVLYPAPVDGDFFAMQENQALSTPQATTLANLPQRENGSSGDEHESDLIQQVSASFGALRLSSDGQLRYFGAATNYHLLEGSRHDEDVEILTTKHEILGRLEQAGLNQEVPEELEKHLLELYFEWHNPSHMNVDEEIFRAARNNPNPTPIEAGCCSDFLVSTM